MSVIVFSSPFSVAACILFITLYKMNDSVRRLARTLFHIREPEWFSVDPISVCLWQRDTAHLLQLITRLSTFYPPPPPAAAPRLPDSFPALLISQIGLIDWM